MDLPTSNPVPYQKLRASLKTGDLLFLHSTDAAGIFIEVLETGEGWPPVSHVGMVINDGGNLYLFDAPGGGDDFPDPYVGEKDNRLYGKKRIPGSLRVSPLDSVLPYYAGFTNKQFWFRQLNAPVTDVQAGALKLFVNRVDGLPFPGQGSDAGELFDLSVNYEAGRTEATTLWYGRYFCAQLIADAYMHMGLLEMDVRPPNGFSPAAFAMNDADELPLVPSVGFGDLIYVPWT